jgi:methionyl aminopeptidase
MAIIIKTDKEIEILREGGKRLARILAEVVKKVTPGVSTKELNDYAEKLIRDGGDEPAFLGYQGDPRDKPYPASLCTSINNEVVHCIPYPNRILKEGDIISLDLGLKHKGLFTDHAVTVPVGKISKASQKLINITKEALAVGIEASKGGNTTGDIGYAIEKFINKRYGIVRTLSGHGVGKKVHEDPYIPDFAKKGKGPNLIPNMVVALEPMLNIGKDVVINGSDGFTIKTSDGSRSAHFEHTILITEGDAEILTAL